MPHFELQRAEKMRDQLNQVSPSFCLVKWKHATINLAAGTAKSCCHHSFRKLESKDSGSSLQFHETEQDRIERGQMLQGAKPDNCSYCWKTEARGHLSNRHHWSAKTWMARSLSEFDSARPTEALTPAWVELNFSSVCNFKCSYCSPLFSSRWLKEIVDFGPYPTLPAHNDLEYLKTVGLSFENENSEMLKRFWIWFEDVFDHIRLLKITGGEPLLSPQTFRLLDMLISRPNRSLNLALNTNLCPPLENWKKFLARIQDLENSRSVRTVCIQPSIDSWGEQAEYIRCGLNFSQFQQNLLAYLTLTKGRVVFTFTMNNLSLCGLMDFWKYVLSLKKEFCQGGRQITVTTEVLQSPAWQGIDLLSPDFAAYLENVIEFVKQNLTDRNSGFNQTELSGLQKALTLMTNPDRPAPTEQRRNFYRFFKEYDRRQGLNFLQTFPEMSDFWHLCESLDAREA